MPLRDHFHPPLSQRRHWHSFHNAWATSLAASLNEQLPDEYFAEPNVQFGIEIDVATFEEQTTSADGPQAPKLWAPPAPIRTIPLPIDEDIVEVAIYSTMAGPVLVGAIELVSPSNKDRPNHRDGFLAKCEAYLHRGIGLVVVDIVTNRTANLHYELLRRLHDSCSARTASPLYASAYRPVGQNGRNELEIWAEELNVGEPLPSMPLWLLGGPCMPAKLEATYERTCLEHRIR